MEWACRPRPGQWTSAGHGAWASCLLVVMFEGIASRVVVVSCLFERVYRRCLKSNYSYFDIWLLNNAIIWSCYEAPSFELVFVNILDVSSIALALALLSISLFFVYLSFCSRARHVPKSRALNLMFDVTLNYRHWSIATEIKTNTSTLSSWSTWTTLKAATKLLMPIGCDN